MDAAEDLSWLDDPPRGAVAHFLERAASWAIDAGKPEDVKRQPGVPCQRPPGRFGRNPATAPFGRGVKGGVFVHPFPAMVAVDAGGRQVAGPADVAGMGRDLFARHAQNGVAIGVRAGGDQDMGRVAQGRVKGRAGPDKRLGPGPGNVVRLVGRPGRADHAPAIGQKPGGKGAGGIAMAEGQKRAGHDAEIARGACRCQRGATACMKLSRRRPAALAPARKIGTIGA